MKKLILNLLLFLFSTSIVIFFLNLIILFNLLNIFDQKNLPRHWALNSDRYFMTFYPNTHNKTLKNYTAILGDSIPFGEGDGWVNKEVKYSISHYLRDRLNKDYLNFSKPGANSVTAVKEFLFSYDRIKKSFFLPEIEKPNEIIIFFEEGDLIANFNSFTNQEDFSSINKFVSNEISDFSNYKHRAKDINIPFLKSSLLVLRENLFTTFILASLEKF